MPANQVEVHVQIRGYVACIWSFGKPAGEIKEAGIVEYITRMNITLASVIHQERICVGRAEGDDDDDVYTRRFVNTGLSCCILC